MKRKRSLSIRSGREGEIDVGGNRGSLFSEVQKLTLQAEEEDRCWGEFERSCGVLGT